MNQDAGTLLGSLVSRALGQVQSIVNTSDNLPDLDGVRRGTTRKCGVGEVALVVTNVWLPDAVLAASANGAGGEAGNLAISATSDADSSIVALGSRLISPNRCGDHEDSQDGEEGVGELHVSRVWRAECCLIRLMWELEVGLSSKTCREAKRAYILL